MTRTTVDIQATLAPVAGAARLGDWSAKAAFGSHHAAIAPMPATYVVKTNGIRRRPPEDSS